VNDDLGNPGGTGGDEQAILELLVPRAQSRLDGQLGDSDAMDSKALGLLGVDAAAIALMTAVRHDVASLWWLPTTVLGLAGALLLAAVWPRRFDLGPDTRRFYETMGASSQLEASRQMLTELLVAIDGNDVRLPAKAKLFKSGFALLVIALLGSLAVALSA
jgi:hypothetical protein